MKYTQRWVRCFGTRTTRSNLVKLERTFKHLERSILNEWTQVYRFMRLLGKDLITFTSKTKRDAAVIAWDILSNTLILVTIKQESRSLVNRSYTVINRIQEYVSRKTLVKTSMNKTFYSYAPLNHLYWKVSSHLFQIKTLDLE